MTYVRNAWYVATSTHDSVPERPLGVRVLNEPIVIWRNAAGELVAFEDRCVHRLAPLSLGRCEAERLRCMYHGLLYDRSGRVVEIPGQDRISNTLRLRSYPVVERYGWVWVWMGDVAADESLIPPVIDVDHPDYTDYISGYGQLDYAAEAFLVNENLLDLSHVAFLHAESFQLSETWARELPKFTKHERSVLTERWIRNAPCGGSLKPGELVDSYTRMDFYVPGVLIISERAYPVGTADELNGQEPKPDRPTFSVSSHMVTPITDRSTRYFYSVAFRRDYDDAVRDRDTLMAYAAKGFAEDKKIIEAQQQNLDATPNWRFISTINDRGVMLYNQIVEKLGR